MLAEMGVQFVNRVEDCVPGILLQTLPETVGYLVDARGELSSYGPAKSISRCKFILKID